MLKRVGTLCGRKVGGWVWGGPSVPPFMSQASQLYQTLILHSTAPAAAWPTHLGSQAQIMPPGVSAPPQVFCPNTLLLSP